MADKKFTSKECEAVRMRVVIIAFGSRGDVQPHIALGTRFQAAGHEVRIVTHNLFAAQVRRLGLDFAPVVGDPQAIVSHEAGQNWLGSGSNFLLFFQRFTRIAEPLLLQAMLDCWEGSADAELIVCSPLAIGTASSIAEKLHIPYWIGAGQPLTPTTTFASPFFPSMSLPSPWFSHRYNQFTYGLSARLFWQLLGPIINRARHTVLHLPPLPKRWLYEELSHQHFHILYYYSPAVLPAPPDWHDNSHVTGYWFLDEPTQWQPPATLLDFLAAGPTPVYVGFGSMQTGNPVQMSETVLQALRLSGQRGILLTGWGGLSPTALPDTVYQIDFVPHDWLFPRVAAVVHHGGAGTMAASLRAGVPSIMIPFFGDQPFWGRRFYDLGIIPEPIPQKHLTATRLATALHSAINNTILRSRVSVLGEQIRAEDGLDKAVRIILGRPRGSIHLR